MKETSLFSAIKRLLPKSLFARALLILVLPTVMVQLVTTYMFFERHWDNVSRHMSTSLAGELALIAYESETSDSKERKELFERFYQVLGIRVALDKGEKAKGWAKYKGSFPELEAELANRLSSPVRVMRDAENEERILIEVQTKQGVLTFRVSDKRLVSPTTRIFIFWMVGTAVILLGVAVLFLRNQIRPIVQLADAAERFGKGQDSPGFRPHGATEVRKAAKAFVTMRERIKRQIATRTEMLAGISHDLRTPLTRMKLQLAMFGDSQEVRDLTGDVSEMEHMIEEYLEFARGQGKEETEQVWLSEYLGEIADNYRRQGQGIGVYIAGDAEVFLRKNAFTRCLNNLINNALKYAKHCTVRTELFPDYLLFYVDDDGGGIPEEYRETVFRPFKRLDPSRNLQSGWVGLGMSIARDVVLSHGGRISLHTSPEGGLRVAIQLPR